MQTILPGRQRFCRRHYGGGRQRGWLPPLSYAPLAERATRSLKISPPSPPEIRTESAGLESRSDLRQLLFGARHSDAGFQRDVDGRATRHDEHRATHQLRRRPSFGYRGSDIEMRVSSPPDMRLDQDLKRSAGLVHFSALK